MKCIYKRVTIIVLLILLTVIFAGCGTQKKALRVIIVPKFEIDGLEGDFPGDGFDDFECEILDAELCDSAFELIRNCPLQTTEEAKKVMKENFPAREEADILPGVKKGTTLTGDNYWKGLYGHTTANYIAQYYECPDPYAVTEMEDLAIVNTAECFDMLDRVIVLRVIVNMDMFLDGATPESTWGVYDSYNTKVKEGNDETLDIFEPAMHNLFDTGSIIIDSILEGKL